MPANAAGPNRNTSLAENVYRIVPNLRNQVNKTIRNKERNRVVAAMTNQHGRLTESRQKVAMRVFGSDVKQPSHPNEIFLIAFQKYTDTPVSAISYVIESNPEVAAAQRWEEGHARMYYDRSQRAFRPFPIRGSYRLS